jgi:lipoprotein-anchoring transpeptidase ErfK/SrfK
VSRFGGDGIRRAPGHRGLAGWLVAIVVVGAVIAVALVIAPGSHPSGAQDKRVDYSPTPARSVKPTPEPAGVLVAWAKTASLPVSASPASKVSESLANPNSLGAPLVMLVDSTRPGWVRVWLPQRPNESSAWVPAKDVSLVRDDEHILVDLATRKVELLKGDSVAFDATAAVGSPQSPTPTGYFYVTELLRVTGADSPYGPYALGLSAFSNTYLSFDGGPGQIAIHGTDDPASVGQYASHGCIRLSNLDITELAAMVETGTPVTITG